MYGTRMVPFAVPGAAVSGKILNTN